MLPWCFGQCFVFARKRNFFQWTKVPFCLSTLESHWVHFRNSQQKKERDSFRHSAITETVAFSLLQMHLAKKGFFAKKGFAKTNFKQDRCAIETQQRINCCENSSKIDQLRWNQISLFVAFCIPRIHKFGSNKSGCPVHQETTQQITKPPWTIVL